MNYVETMMNAVNGLRNFVDGFSAIQLEAEGDFDGAGNAYMRINNRVTEPHAEARVLASLARLHIMKADTMPEGPQRAAVYMRAVCKADRGLQVLGRGEDRPGLHALLRYTYDTAQVLSERGK